MIVTRTGDQNAASGVTSHGEIYYPIVQKNGSVVGFSENACKVGCLTDRIAIGFAGDVAFGYSLLNFLYEGRQQILNYASLLKRFQDATVSLSPTTLLEGTQVEFLLCFSGSNLEIGFVVARVGKEGAIEFQYDIRAVDENHCVQKVIGSG